MSAARKAWIALGDFLRGFVGVASLHRCCDHEHAPESATPAAARAALSDIAARRGRCC